MRAKLRAVANPSGIEARASGQFCGIEARSTSAVLRSGDFRKHPTRLFSMRGTEICTVLFTIPGDKVSVRARVRNGFGISQYPSSSVAVLVSSIQELPT